MRLVHRVSWAVVILLGAGASLLAQSPSAPSPPDAEAEPGIPIKSEVVQKACGACHAADEKGCLTRISGRRTTPEGWQETVKRMATLNGAPLEPAQAREVVRYLANELGLAPEEARPAAFEVERRLIEFSYPDKDTQRACGACHSIGRPMLQRRTGEEWDLVVAMHRGYYPLVDFQAFRNPAPPPNEPGPDGKPPDRRHPMEKALAHLKATYPLSTPEWSAWSANRRNPSLAGRWAMKADQIGHEPVFGEVTIAAKPGQADEFTTEVLYAPAGGGPAVVRRGQAVVYTGFQWRGRSSAGQEGDALREVMFVKRDGRTISGRWFTGAYDETGLDVTLLRISGEPMVLGVTPQALRVGATASVRLHGANLGSTLTAKDVDFGPGVRVTHVAPKDGGGLAVDLEVAADAPEGVRDVFVAGASGQGAAVVFKTVDTLKVTPQAGLARVGGVRFPKRTEQFEARAWSYGRDGKPDTKDDLDLGPVSVAWSIEEFTAILGDDDKSWAGKIDATGLFAPAEDGPNPKRQGSRNNVGDLWVVATLPAGGPLQPKAPLRARAHLIVTVPLYARWDQAEVAP